MDTVGSLFWYHYLGIYFVGLLVFFLVSGLTDRLGAGEWTEAVGPLPECVVFAWPLTFPIAVIVGMFRGAFCLGEKIRTIRITVDPDGNRDVL